jgi:hypothetical protein
MKKLVLAVFALVLFASMMFAQRTGDRIVTGFNNQGMLTGATGTFTLGVIKPMTISQSMSGGNLGVFVQSTTPYTLTPGNAPAIVWDMTTEPGYEFFMRLTTTETDKGNNIKLGYDYYQLDDRKGTASDFIGFPYPLLVNAGGWWTEGYQFTGLRVRVTEVQALNSGNSSFPFVLCVSYTSF